MSPILECEVGLHLLHSRKGKYINEVAKIFLGRKKYL